MLTLQLRELEDAAIVQRTVYAEVPPRVDYALTEQGQLLKPVLLAMRTWGMAYQQFMAQADGAQADDARMSEPTTGHMDSVDTTEATCAMVHLP